MVLKNCWHAASSLLAVLTASLLVFSTAGVPVVASSWEEQEDKTHGETLPSLRGSQNDLTTMMQERRLPGFVVDRLNCFSAGTGTLVCNWQGNLIAGGAAQSITAQMTCAVVSGSTFCSCNSFRMNGVECLVRSMRARWRMG